MKSKLTMSKKKKRKLINKCISNENLNVFEKLIYIDIVNNSKNRKYSISKKDLMKHHHECLDFIVTNSLPKLTNLKCDVEGEVHENGEYELIYHFTIGIDLPSYN